MAASRNSSEEWERSEERPVGEPGTTGEDIQDVAKPDELPFIMPGADDSEPVRFAEEIARRGGEFVFMTRTAEEAEALRDWGLLAVARPENARWCEAACEAI